MLKAPIRLKRIDTEKGLLYRSRLVATEIRPKWQEAIFAATPLLEVMRALISIAASGNTNGKPDDGLCLMSIDVSRANFYARSKRRVFIDLPAEDPRAGEPGLCGELERKMYGTYDIAALWGEDYSGHLVDGGVRQGRGFALHLPAPEERHSDDGAQRRLLCRCLQASTKYLEQVLASQYDIKVKMIGPHAGDEKSMKALGRTVTYRKWGIEYEADPSHYQKVVKVLGLETCKKVPTLWVKESFMTNQEREALKMRRVDNLKFDDTNLRTPHRIPEEEGELDADLSLEHGDGRRYMSASASLNFVALDQPRLM